MAFIVRNGSLAIVARSAADVLRTIDTFVSDDETSEPVVSTFEGGLVDIGELRQLVDDTDS